MSPSVSKNAIGRVVADRYRLIDKVGVGPSSTVFLADDVRLRRRVTVKMLDETLASEPGFVSRFRAEMGAAAGLRHPHIGMVHDWGVDQAPYVVGEYFPNGSLQDLIVAGVRLDPSQVLQLSLAAGRALAYAHERGVVHRDIRPSNLLFAVDGRVRVVDFGLARAFAEAASTEPMGIGATGVRYASPEQARGQNVDGKADVYSLVLGILEAVSGEAPFAADTPLGSLMARLDRAPRIPEPLGSLRDPLARATTIDSAERLDAAGLVTALMAVADDFADADPIEFGRTRSVPSQPVAVDTEAPDDITLVVLPDEPRGQIFPTALPDISADRPDDAGDSDDPVDSDELGPARATPADRDLQPSTPAQREGDDDAAAEQDRPVDEDGDEDGDEVVTTADAGRQRRSRRRWRFAWIMLAVVVVVGGGTVGWFVYQAQRTPTHLVPQLTKSTPDVARARLEALGFRVKTDRVRRDGTVAGQLLGVDPAAGSRIREGDTVTLTVSDGQTLVRLPASVVGAQADNAATRLREVGLEPGATDEEFSEDIAAGLVISTVPAVGKRLEKGSQVALVLSKGPKPRVVPSVSGMSPGEAKQALISIGLKPVVVERYDAAVDKGGLIGVEPGAGTTVQRGSNVDVVVSKGLLVAVPSLGGVTSVSGAMDKLQGVGLIPGKVQGSGQLTGRPVGFAPASGQMVPKGSVVDIVVE